MRLIETLSPRSANAPESGIVEVFNYGRGREGLIPLWAGEGDSPTPDFISRAAADALIAGETFYTYQRGIPDLRQALANYYARHFGTSLSSENFIVTASGMHAIKIAAEMIAAPGDEMIYLTPSWPNISAALEVSGAIATPLELEFVGGAWKLDLNKLESAIGPKTRGIFINTPSNPTGWTATLDDLRAILDIARRKGLWIMADEIYAHFYYGGGRAASFLDVMQADDRIIFVNSFSKNWSMTGWRVGWVVVPEELGQGRGKPHPVFHLGRSAIHAAGRNRSAGRGRSRHPGKLRQGREKPRHSLRCVDCHEPRRDAQTRWRLLRLPEDRWRQG